MLYLPTVLLSYSHFCRINTFLTRAYGLGKTQVQADEGPESTGYGGAASAGLGWGTS